MGKHCGHACSGGGGVCPRCAHGGDMCRSHLIFLLEVKFVIAAEEPPAQPSTAHERA